MTAKHPTPQGISALLRKAGFKRSESNSTRIRGHRSRSSGFVAFKRGDGEVAVYHETGFFMINDAIRRRRSADEDAYADAIEAAGYAVERGGGGMFGPIMVTAISETPTMVERAAADTTEER
jgi:hypothetical protein